MRKSLILLGLSVICVFAVSLSDAIEEEDILVYYSFDKLNGKKFTDDSGRRTEITQNWSGKVPSLMVHSRKRCI